MTAAVRILPWFFKEVIRMTLPLVILSHGMDVNTQETEPLSADLTALSLEELMELEATSAARKPQLLSDTASAIFVITPDDIRRSGATFILELLRRVPGLQVARLDANKWTVGARGFSERFANKLLVLMDGRSLLPPSSPACAGRSRAHPWRTSRVSKVIRGPGAALWGANAVNGVINILTKPTQDTQGGTGECRGRDRRADVCHRTLRLYANHFERDGFVDAAGTDTPNDWYPTRTGFRLDWPVSERDGLTLQGDIYDGRGAWRPRKGIEISLVGESLLDNQHPELRKSSAAFTPGFPGTSEDDKRAVLGSGCYIRGQTTLFKS
jgi:iron complex outermembrane receptor protein